MSEFDAALRRFIRGCNDIIREHLKDVEQDTTRVEAAKAGQRYVRIVRDDTTHRKAHCFVEIATGDVLRSYGWTRPQQGAMGNIFAEDNGLGRMGPYGPG